MLPIWVVNSVRRLLLLIFKTWTVFKLMPVRVLKKVLVIKTLFAFLTPVVNESPVRAGRAVHAISPVSTNSGMVREVRRVKFVRVKDPVILVMVLLPKLTKLPASAEITLPLMVSGPSRLMVPAAWGPKRTSPLIVEQVVYWAASAWELMVAVACEQREALWARIRKTRSALCLDQLGWLSRFILAFPARDAQTR